MSVPIITMPSASRFQNLDVKGEENPAPQGGKTLAIRRQRPDTVLVDVNGNVVGSTKSAAVGKHMNKVGSSTTCILTSLAAQARNRPHETKEEEAADVNKSIHLGAYSICHKVITTAQVFSAKEANKGKKVHTFQLA
jgi:hypothetical protein